MSEKEIDEKEKRDELKAKRNLLFERLLKNPLNIGLAVEIKRIDDQIAECIQHLERSNRARLQ